MRGTPEWALDRVLFLSGLKRSEVGDMELFHAFAAYIASHEKPPVDPIDEALTESLRAFCPNDLAIYGTAQGVRIFREGLILRGIALSKEPTP